MRGIGSGSVVNDWVASDSYRYFEWYSAFGGTTLRLTVTSQYWNYLGDAGGDAAQPLDDSSAPVAVYASCDTDAPPTAERHTWAGTAVSAFGTEGVGLRGAALRIAPDDKGACGSGHALIVAVTGANRAASPPSNITIGLAAESLPVTSLLPPGDSRQGFTLIGQSRVNEPAYVGVQVTVGPDSYPVWTFSLWSANETAGAGTAAPPTVYASLDSLQPSKATHDWVLHGYGPGTSGVGMDLYLGGAWPNQTSGLPHRCSDVPCEVYLGIYPPAGFDHTRTALWSMSNYGAVP